MSRWSNAERVQRRLAPLVLLVLAGCSSPAADVAVEVPNGTPGRAVSAVDDTGRTVRLPRPAERVISLLPAGTETLVALGALDRLVGRTRYDVDPEVSHLPSVGGGLDPSLEAVVALDPDLVVAWESPGESRLRRRLEALGIPVFAIATRDTVAIFRNFRDLGHLIGRDAAADSLARRVRAELEAVRVTVPAGTRPSVLYVVSIDPPMIAGTDNFLAELVEVAGGIPMQISADRAGGSPQVSLEELVRRQPDGIVLPVWGDPGTTLEQLRREPGWRELRAVQEGRIATVPADLANRPGPRIGETAALLREELRRWQRP